MFNLIPISLLISAVGGIIYIISNHLSELKDDKEKNDEFRFNLKTRFISWINQLPMDSVKDHSLSLTQKMLHRLRLFLLKSDNILMRLIVKISQRDKAKNDNDNINRNNADFWKDIAKNKDEEPVNIPMAEPEVKISLAIKSEAAKKFFNIKPAKKNLKIRLKKSKTNSALPR